MHITWKNPYHKTVKSVLTKQLETNSPAHAYLFKGQLGAGKKDLAYELAEKLLETEKLSTHPDFVALGLEEKSSVQDIRDLITKLSVKPFSSAYTVAVVNNVHLLNASAGNALLKQLEEPSPTSVIILTASGSVLPTITSRCQAFILTKYLAESFPEIVTGKVDELERLQASGTAEKIAAIKEWADLESDELLEVFAAWLSRVKDSLSEDPAQFRLARAILEAQKRLATTNMNKKFVLQQLFLG